MPRKVDFHTEWVMPDPTGCEDVESDERKSDDPTAQNPDMEKGQAVPTAQASKPQTKEKSFVARGAAY